MNPNKLKLISKGIDSVVSRVTNLVDVNPEITHEAFCSEVKSEFIKAYNNPIVQT